MPNFFCFLFLFPLFREGVSYSFQRERTWGPGGNRERTEGEGDFIFTTWIWQNGEEAAGGGRRKSFFCFLLLLQAKKATPPLPGSRLAFFPDLTVLANREVSSTYKSTNSGVIETTTKKGPFWFFFIF